MSTLVLIDDFLAQPRIAVVGISRQPATPGRAIAKRLQETGHTVYLVNPNAAEIDGLRCYASLDELRGEGIGAVMLVGTPELSEAAVKDCEALGIRRVWLHRGLGPGSYSAAAESYCREHGLAVISRGCPMMFAGAVDPAHRLMRVLQDPAAERDPGQLRAALLFGLLGWALGAAALGLATVLWSVAAALWVRLAASPVVFGLLGWLHGRRFPRRRPLPTALLWLALAVILDLFIVGWLVVGLGIFASPVGTWVPFGLLTFAAWLGLRASRRRSPAPAEG
jgi:uncharacterized protein